MDIFMSSRESEQIVILRCQVAKETWRQVAFVPMWEIEESVSVIIH